MVVFAVQALHKCIRDFIWNEIKPVEARVPTQTLLLKNVFSYHSTEFSKWGFFGERSGKHFLSPVSQCNCNIKLFL